MTEYVEKSVIEEYLKHAIFGADRKIDKWVGQMPAADVRENVHAHWIKHEDDWNGDYWECSACHDEYIVIVYGGVMCYEHCPTCGAVMDECGDAE